MASTLRLRAPAKLNLYLRVLGRRPDGYHEIETLFERIDVADELTFAPQPRDVTLTCDQPAMDCGEDNLILKAARVMQATFGVTQGAAIRLAKRIPIAAGLGGGSSDAATTLIGLNRLWGTRGSAAQLRELGAALGSDVPFFLQPQPFAIGRGRGERCEGLTAAHVTLWHVVVTPEARLATSEVYAEFDAHTSALTAPPPSITIGRHALRNGPAMAGLANGLWNDLEPAAIRRCPVIDEIRALLQEGGCEGRLTSGSGPSVFGLCRDPAHAQQTAAFLRHHGQPGWTIHVAGTDINSDLHVRDGE